MADPHLINLTNKVAELECQKWSCDWDRLAVIQNRIIEYRAKLAQGIEFEPAF